MEIPASLLNGTVNLQKIFRTSSYKHVLNFMPAGFRSPADIKALFDSDNKMTVCDLLHRFQNYVDHSKLF